MHEIHQLMRERAGVTTWSQLRQVAPRRAIEHAVADGWLHRCGRGRFVTDSADPALVAAIRLHGVAWLRTAALLHGWSVKTAPAKPEITVRRNRKLDAVRQELAAVSWRSLRPQDVHGFVTTPYRTVVDCARWLPFDEAVAIIDSALRRQDVSRSGLQRTLDTVQGRCAAAVREVFDFADGRSYNPFESVLRTICRDVPGLQVIPQFQIRQDGILAVVDLADPRLQLVVEAEGYETHGTRTGFDKDVARYTGLSVQDWLVVRFTWPEVMHRPEYVRETLMRAVALRSGHSDVRKSA